MVPSLSFKPCQITKPPSASPINPPQSSELLRRSLTVVWSFINTSRPCRDAMRREAVRCRSGIDRCVAKVDPGSVVQRWRSAAPRPEHESGSILLLRKPERIDHLALRFRNLDDELLVVLGILVARHH